VIRVPREDGVLEIRTYRLLPGTGARFHRAVLEKSLPMLERWGVEVVAYGPSVDDADLYYLVRAYASLDDLRESQDAFYGSDEWRLGPREEIVSMIESDISVVVPAGTLAG
jgi:NIPSNAP